MPTEHIVQQGDCFASIGKLYGFADWRIIYNHDRNAALRDNRPDPHVLLPGDQVFIPDKELRSESRQTEMLHTFKTCTTETRLRLLIRGVDGSPLPGKKYQLVLDDLVYDGVLPSNGRLDQPIPPDAVAGLLLVWPEGDAPDVPFVWTVKLGHLDPVEHLTGVQARLNNLGYSCGAVDGVDGPLTRAAIQAFQKDHGLTIDGIPGPETQATLMREHAC